MHQQRADRQILPHGGLLAPRSPISQALRRQLLTRTLLVCFATAAVLCVAPSSAREVQRTIAVELTNSAGVAPASAPLVRVNSQGRPQAVLDVRAVEPGEVGVHVYFDLPAALPLSVRAAARQLAERATSLSQLGVAQIAVTLASVSSPAAGSATAPAIAASLQSVEDRAGEAGELWLKRRALERDLEELTKSSGALGEKRRRIVTHYQEELEIAEWQQGLLEDWLLGSEPAAAPKVLLLVRSRQALDPASYALTLIEEHEVPLDELTRQRLADRLAQRQREFARAAAALGCTIHVVDIAPETEQASGRDESASDLLSGLAPAHLEFTQAGPGTIVDAPAQLDELLASLQRRFLVTFQLQGDERDAAADPEGSAAPGSAPDAMAQESAEISGRPDPALVPLDLSVGSGLRLRGPRWTHTEPPRLLAQVRARRLLQDGESGDLAVVASLVGEFAGAATLETVLAFQGGEESALAGDTSDRLRLTVVTARLDRDFELRQLYGGGARLDRGAWALQSPIELPEDRTAIVVVAEDLRSGLWGAALAEPSDVGVIATLSSAEATVESAGAATIHPLGLAGSDLSAPGAAEGARASFRRPPRSPRAADSAPSGAVAGKMLEILPPRGRPLVGKQTFKILLTNTAVQRVVFELDGEEVHEDDDRPFQATLDLGQAASERQLRAVAYSSSGALLGEDVLRINGSRARDGIEFTRVDLSSASGDVEVVAELRAPAGQTLDRVELYRNQRLIATLTRPPFRATLPGPARPDADFVRAVAWMREGGFFEDVQLLGDAVIAEEVDVNLVEIYTVVTNSDGEPLAGLGAGDFEVFLGNQRIEIERFARAEDVSLSLGVVIDTSESMYSLMDDTKRAASRFLSDTLSTIDRAFVVEFDDRPRLVHPTSNDVMALIRSLASLQPSGMTALYDSILFAHLQFEPGLGRKAIVLLTDGDDFNSKFSYRKAYQTAASAGLPIYFLSLAGFDEDRRSFRKSDLEALSKASGGRVFYVSSMPEVVAAYAQIAEELRNQYVLAFTSDAPLTDAEIDKIKVQVRGKRRGDLRWVVGRE